MFKRVVVIAILSIFTLSSCENIGILGYSGVKGSDVEQELKDAYYNAAIVRLLVYYGTSSASIAGNASFLVGLLIGGEITAAVAGVNPSTHYTRESVDDCVNRINTIGWIFAYPTITCRLNKVPLIQLGPTGDNEFTIINIGPIGL